MAKRTRTCSVEGCERLERVRGLCEPHWEPLRIATPAERFWAHVATGVVPACRPDLDPCWMWSGANAEGYGRFTFEGLQRQAHRLAYEWTVGPIPDGLQIDHLCRVVSCVNPNHLEPVTCRENTMRGTSPAALNSRKTHCIRDHPFDEANTYMRNGFRTCRTCVALRRNSPSPRMSPEATSEASRLRADGATWTSLGRRYGVDPDTVKRYVTGTSWRDRLAARS